MSEDYFNLLSLPFLPSSVSPHSVSLIYVWAELHAAQMCILNPYTTVPQNVTYLEMELLDIIKFKW